LYKRIFVFLSNSETLPTQERERPDACLPKYDFQEDYAHVWVISSL
jgi:hypothetical protein